MFRMHSRGRATAAATLALLLAATACSAEADAPAAAPSTAADSTPSPTATDDGAGTIQVTASDYAFAGLPSTIEAGTTISLANASEVELHEFVAIRLPDDEARPVADLLQLPEEELVAFFPLVTSVIIAPPGAPEGLVVEGSATLAEPGRYAVMCAIPTGADPDEYLAAAAESEGGPPEVEGGPPHFVHGMWAEVNVVASS